MPNTNQEIHPAKPAGGGRNGVPGVNCWRSGNKKSGELPAAAEDLDIYI